MRHCSTFECCIAHVAAPMAAKPTKGFAPSDFPFPVELWAKTLNDGTSAGGPSQRPVLLVLPDPILAGPLRKIQGLIGAGDDLACRDAEG